MKTLQQLFDQHTCDKGSARHRYDRVYEPVFKKLQNEKINILEVGILRGESLESHLGYFPNALMYAIDIFSRVPSKDVPILQHERVKWCNCDSVEGPNEKFNNMVGDTKFDIIIDDGLHTHDSQRYTFENFIPWLKDGGTYFIEDVWAFDQMTPKQKRDQWITRHPNDYSDQQYNNLLKILEPYTTKFYDLRKGFQLDTFIIEVNK